MNIFQISIISLIVLNIILIISVCFLFGQKNSIENFTDNNITEAITNLSNISNEIMANGTLTIPANEVDFNGNAHFQSGNTVTIDGTLNVANLNILPRGCVIAWYGNNTPQGWFHNIPTGWVICDGQNGTPDLRGRFVLGSGHTNGLTDRELGHTGGEETHTLTTNEIPAHSHNIGTDGHIGPVFISTWGSGNRNLDGSGWQSSSVNTENTGGNGSHNNMPPFYVLTYIMKT